MRRPEIIIDDKIPFIEGRLEQVADVVYASPESINPTMLKDADAVLVRTRTRCDASLLEGSNVKLVATATIGMDHIDTAWCEKNEIAVRNSAGCNAPGVAQYVWSMLLRSGFRPGMDVLGIIGKGNIGSIVADWGRQSGTEILVCDPPRRRAGMTDENYLPLEELLRKSDAVTIHTPLSREGEDATWGLLGPERLSMMKDNSLLINAARGGIIDEKAWIKELKSGRIKGIADVWTGEPAINEELLRLVEVATPHIAGYSLEGKRRATRMVLEAVEEVLGLEADKSGLTPDYVSPEQVDLKVVVDSFDPSEEDLKLRKDPANFEILRESYKYRHEPEYGK